MWLTVDPIHLAGRLDINIHPLGAVTAVSCRIGDDVTAFGRFFSVRWWSTQLWACGEEGKRSHVDDGRSHSLGRAVGYQY